MNEKLIFRQAVEEDAGRIWQIIQQAKEQMRRLGSQQWQEGYPTPETIANDVALGNGYMLCEEERVIAYGAVIFSGEPAYETIQGKWMDDEPYVVVHRLAVADEMKQRGIATLFMRKVEVLSFQKGISRFRVDTNFDNHYMHRMLKRLGFAYCGEIQYERGSRMAYEKQNRHADKKRWHQFLSTFLLALGVAFTVAGIIFFFAYNWEELPKFAKLGGIELLLVATVSLVIFTTWSKLVKQIILTGATFLIGTLFAVYGQIYQTGADAYDLFLGWALFTLLWALAIRFAPLWLTFVGLLCTTVWLYARQIVPDNEWLATMLINSITWLCAITTFVAERMCLKGKLSSSNHWLTSVMGIAALLHTSTLLIIAIYDHQASIFIPLITTLSLFATGIWFGWRQKRLFYLSTIPFAFLIILISLLIRNIYINAISMFYLTLLTIASTTSLIYTLTHLKKKWYGKEE